MLDKLILGVLGGALHGKLEKQLVIPSADLPALADGMKAQLAADQADASLQNLTHEQLISIVKAADLVVIRYVEKRVGV